MDDLTTRQRNFSDISGENGEVLALTSVQVSLNKVPEKPITLCVDESDTKGDISINRTTSSASAVPVFISNALICAI